MKIEHRATTITAGVAAVLLLTACTTVRSSPSADPPAGTPATTGSTGTTTPPGPDPTAGSARPSTGADPQATGVVPIRVLVGDRALLAELDDNPTARDLSERLPVTLMVDDLNGVEKTGRLPFALTTEGVPRGADPEVGEIGYYAPGRDLVLYYGDVGFFDGIVRIGRFADDTNSLRDLPDGLTITLERARPR